MLRPKSYNLIFVILFTIVATLFTYTGVGNPAFRTILALPFMLFLPGYTLLTAIGPRTPMGRPEFLLLSLGLSIAITVLCGLVLNWTPIGLQAQSWSIVLGAIILIVSLIGLTRRQEVLPAASYSFSIGLDVVQQIMIGLALVVAVAAFLIARQAALQQPDVSFTQLWLLPPQEAGSATIQIGIFNQEKETIAYRLQLINGPALIQQWSVIELEPEQKWETTVELPVDVDRSKPVEARLYRRDTPGEIYRETLIWLGQTP